MPANYKPARSHMTSSAGSKGPEQIRWASPIQKAVFEHGPTPIVASGGFGAGKTRVLCLKAVYLMTAFPGFKVAIARRTFEDLKHTTMDTFFKVCPPALYNQGGQRADSQKFLKLNPVVIGGKTYQSKVIWLHLDDPETENVVKGLEINGFLFDQAEEIREGIFDLMVGRLLRWEDAYVPPEMVAAVKAMGLEWPFTNPETGVHLPPPFASMTANPDIEMHWLYRRFHEESPEHWDRKLPDPNDPSGVNKVSYHDLGYRMFHMDSRDNVFLPKANLQTMLSKDEAYVRRYVRGEWGQPEGQIHLIPPESLLSVDSEWVQSLLMRCTLHRSLDHGDTAPTACLWFAVDREGNIYCYREYYVPEKLISYHRQQITSLSRTWGREVYQQQPADPQIFVPAAQVGGKRWSVADEYSDTVNGDKDTAIWWQRGDKDEYGTRNRISEYLQVDKTRIHPLTRELGSPRLFFILRSPQYPQGCESVLREMRSQRRLKLGLENGKPIFADERDESVPDHSYDALRYFMATRASAAEAGRLAKTNDPRTADAVFQRSQQWRRSGGFKRMAKEMLSRHRDRVS